MNTGDSRQGTRQKTRRVERRHKIGDSGQETQNKRQKAQDKRQET
jgi:TFIIF-interacting CTD phosphatase-like protein